MICTLQPPSCKFSVHLSITDIFTYLCGGNGNNFGLGDLEDKL